MEIVWQHKSIAAEAHNLKDAETSADLYSFADVSSSLLEGLSSIETLAEADWVRVEAIRSLLLSSASAEFFLLGLLGDFALKGHENLMNSEKFSSVRSP